MDRLTHKLFGLFGAVEADALQAMDFLNTYEVADGVSIDMVKHHCDGIEALLTRVRQAIEEAKV